jgi:hypothetical protein
MAISWLPRRFSVRAMLVAISLLAPFLAWYGVRVRAMQFERELLSGTWQMIDSQGNPVLNAGKSIHISFNDPNRVLRFPHGKTGQIDFRSEQWQGPSRAIYRREGNRLRFAQAAPNDNRPSVFDKTKCQSVWLVERIK